MPNKPNSKPLRGAQKRSRPVQRGSNTLYNRCLFELLRISSFTNVPADPDEVDRLVLLVSKEYIPGESDLGKIINRLTTNSVYGFDDNIPF